MLGMSVNEFERVVAIDPDLRAMPLPRKLFWNQYAYGLIREGRIEEARRLLERVLVDEGDDPGLLTQLGQTYFVEGDTDRAEATWRKALQVDARTSEAWLALGRQAMKRGAFEEAERSLQRAVMLAPESIEALYALDYVAAVRGAIDLPTAPHLEGSHRS